MGQVPDPRIAKWTSCFEDVELERRFRQNSLAEQQSRAVVFAWIIAIVPAVQLFGEAEQVLAGHKSIFVELLPRIFCSISSLAFIANARKISNYRILDHWSMTYGVGLIAFTIYLMFVRPELSQLMLLTGLIGSICVVYFFVPLTVVRVAMLGILLSVIGAGTCLFLRDEIRADWFRLVQWVVALNCFGYFGIRSRDANIRYIFWQSEELFRQKVELEQAYHAEKAAYDRFLQFAELISHEFRNCLAVVKGKAQLMRLANELGAPPDLNASLAIERAADRMDYLFSQWLASDSFVESGFAVRVQRVSLKAFLERVVSETHISRSHPISLSPVSNIDLDIDTDLFVLALGNIIGNAVKYSPDGGKIEITAKSSEDRIEIVIADHGIGIAAADRELIFNKYYRVRYDNGVNGLGLGLFFVRRVVKLHGGTVRAEPNPGGGSIFIISLPYIGDTNHANVGICR